tara:strand:- start:49 stop:306 length:258 start_codon:yes stop_codon:yes gene_type:complete
MEITYVYIIFFLCFISYLSVLILEYNHEALELHKETLKKIKILLFGTFIVTIVIWKIKGKNYINNTYEGIKNNIKMEKLTKKYFK